MACVEPEADSSTAKETSDETVALDADNDGVLRAEDCNDGDAVVI